MDMMEDMRAGGDRSAMRDKMGILNEQTDIALAEILMADQMEKYKEIQTERQSQRRRSQS